MHVVDKLLCCAKMCDNNIYYLVEWGNQFKMKPSWMEHQELSFYIKETCHVWHQFNASWDATDNHKVSKKEKKEMELESKPFLGRTGGCNDIDTFLLGEDWYPSPVYDEDGHFCVDEDCDTVMTLVMLKLVMLKWTLTIDG